MVINSMTEETEMTGMVIPTMNESLDPAKLLKQIEERVKQVPYQ